MRSSELYNILSASDNALKIKQDIAGAIPDFKRGLAERGRSAPVCIENDNINFIISETHLDNLCSWFVQGKINDIEIEYIASMIDLCSDFEYADNHIEEAVASLAEFKSDNRDTLRVVQRILKRKAGAT